MDSVWWRFSGRENEGAQKADDKRQLKVEDYPFAERFLREWVSGQFQVYIIQKIHQYLWDEGVGSFFSD